MFVKNAAVKQLENHHKRPVLMKLVEFSRTAEFDIKKRASVKRNNGFLVDNLPIWTSWLILGQIVA